ncbi:MAG: hypothetical protein JF628_03715 [Sphingomonas sp.]|nr:hypothetical protein [Sphingomonas sp.]
MTAFQKAPIPSAPRTVVLALDQGEKLPLGISPDLIAAAVDKAGFAFDGDAPRYRLVLAATLGSSGTGSYIPADGAATQPIWVRSLRARLSRGDVLRVTALLIDGQDNRELWRGTGTLRTSDPGQAPALAREVLAQLPHG